MTIDKGLVERIRENLPSQYVIDEKKMFGGLCFMVQNHMCCGVVQGKFVARIGPDFYPLALLEPYVAEMDFTGRPLKGMVFIDAEALAEDVQLKQWIMQCIKFIAQLPRK